MRHEGSVSKFMLGTVQLGVNYGMANTTGKPSEESAFRILDTAVKCGVNAIDTAVHYGTSEEVVGAWAKARKIRPFIVSKFKLYSDDPLAELEKEIGGTLARLPSDMQIFAVYFRSPRMVPIAYKVMATDGQLSNAELKTNSGAPEFASIGTDVAAYDMAADVSAPKDYTSTSYN